MKTRNNTNGENMLWDQEMEEGDFNEPHSQCELCGGAGRIPASNGRDEYLGDGMMPCPDCMKGAS